MWTGRGEGLQKVHVSPQVGGSGFPKSTHRGVGTV